MLMDDFLEQFKKRRGKVKRSPAVYGRVVRFPRFREENASSLLPAVRYVSECNTVSEDVVQGRFQKLPSALDDVVVDLVWAWCTIEFEGFDC